MLWYFLQVYWVIDAFRAFVRLTGFVNFFPASPKTETLAYMLDQASTSWIEKWTSLGMHLLVFLLVCFCFAFVLDTYVTFRPAPVRERKQASFYFCLHRASTLIFIFLKYSGKSLSWLWGTHTPPPAAFFWETLGVGEVSLFFWSWVERLMEVLTY